VAGAEIDIETESITVDQIAGKDDNPGRNAGYPAPPGQIPASGTTALGSCLR